MTYQDGPHLAKDQSRLLHLVKDAKDEGTFLAQDGRLLRLLHLFCDFVLWQDEKDGKDEGVVLLMQWFPRYELFGLYLLEFLQVTRLIPKSMSH